MWDNSKQQHVEREDVTGNQCGNLLPHAQAVHVGSAQRVKTDRRTQKTAAHSEDRQPQKTAAHRRQTAAHRRQPHTEDIQPQKTAAHRAKTDSRTQKTAARRRQPHTEESRAQRRAAHSTKPAHTDGEMKSRLASLALLLCALHCCCVALPETRWRPMLGAATPIQLTDPGLHTAAAEATRLFNSGLNSRTLYRLDRLTKATRQIVSGLKYVFEADLKSTECSKSEGRVAEDCNFHDDKVATVFKCRFDVWTVPWRKQTKVLSQSCQQNNPISPSAQPNA